MSLRQSSSIVARTYFFGRHGRLRSARVVHKRFDDILLLLLAVAIALVIRGVPRHQVVSGLEDAGWAALAVALYLPIVFFVGVGEAARSLRRWDVRHQPIVQGVMLTLSPATGGIASCGGRCVVRCSDGSTHSCAARPDSITGGMAAIYNANFPSTGTSPPHGDHVALWYVKESPRDGWIKVAEDPFTYRPAGGTTTC